MGKRPNVTLGHPQVKKGLGRSGWVIFQDRERWGTRKGSGERTQWGGALALYAGGRRRGGKGASDISEMDGVRIFKKGKEGEGYNQAAPPITGGGKRGRTMASG